MVEERKRGILTKADRRYLHEQTDKEMDASNKRVYRQRIRQRLRDSVLDFRLLLEQLSDKDRKLALNDLEFGQRLHSLVYGIAFLLLCAADQNELFEEDTEAGLESVLELAIQQFESIRRESPISVSVDVEINRDYAGLVERAQKKYDEGITLTDEELGALVRQGKISPTEHLIERQEKRAELREKMEEEGRIGPPPEEQLERLREMKERDSE